MKVAIYARVSSEKQEKQETINSQLEALREYATSNKYTVFNEFIDEGYSGELLARPALDELRDYAKTNSFEAVLIHSPDRLSRKFLYAGLIQEELTKNNVQVIFLNRPQSSNSPEDKLLEHVQGAVAEYEKAKILERTRRGRMHKAKSGQLVTSQSPFGYSYVRSDKNKNMPGHYVVNEKEARVVNLIFDLFVNKKQSIRAIARELTKRGIPPQRGKQWRTSSLHRIIRNETYAGITHYNKNLGCEPTSQKKNNGKYRRYKNTSMRLRPKEEWVAIKLPQELVLIDRKVFEQAQKQLEENSRLSPRNVKYRYLLRGLCVCGNCQSPYHGEPCHGKLYYRCGDRRRQFPLPRKCKVPSVYGETLEQAVWEKFCQTIRNPKLIMEQVGKLSEKRAAGAENFDNEITKIEKMIDNLKLQEGRLLDAYRATAISVEQLKEHMQKIDVERKQLTDEKGKLQSQQQSILSESKIRKSVKGYCQLIEQKLDSLNGNFEAKQFLLRLAVNQIIIDNKRVTIKCIVPLEADTDEEASSRIASTEIGYYGCRRRRSQARA